MKTLNKDLAAVQLGQVIEQLKDMSDSSLQVCHNNYCIELCYEDEIYDNDEYTINEHFNTPFEALLAIEHYNLSDNYFYFRNGNLISFNYLTGENSPITFSELAQWLINEDKLVDYDIAVITIDDMLASIEDNISDDEDMLYSLMDYLNIGYDIDKASLLGADYETNLIDDCMYILEGSITDKTQDIYERLVNVTEYLGINY